MARTLNICTGRPGTTASGRRSRTAAAAGRRARTDATSGSRVEGTAAAARPHPGPHPDHRPLQLTTPLALTRHPHPATL